jgi:hypothetical protein
MHSSVYLMAEGRKHIGTLNICGGIDNSSGTLETLVYEMRAHSVGLLAVQETNTIGLEVSVARDRFNRCWVLHTGGPSTIPKLGGTGFLVSPDFTVLNFVALSPRVVDKPLPYKR